MKLFANYKTGGKILEITPDYTQVTGIINDKKIKIDVSGGLNGFNLTFDSVKESLANFLDENKKKSDPKITKLINSLSDQIRDQLLDKNKKNKT